MVSGIRKGSIVKDMVFKKVTTTPFPTLRFNIFKTSISHLVIVPYPLFKLYQRIVWLVSVRLLIPPHLTSSKMRYSLRPIR